MMTKVLLLTDSSSARADQRKIVMRHKFATFAGLMTVVNIRTSFKGNLLEKKKKRKKKAIS